MPACDPVMLGVATCVPVLDALAPGDTPWLGVDDALCVFDAVDACVGVDAGVGVIDCVGVADAVIGAGARPRYAS